MFLKSQNTTLCKIPASSNIAEMIAERYDLKVFGSLQDFMRTCKEVYDRKKASRGSQASRRITSPPHQPQYMTNIDELQHRDRKNVICFKGVENAQTI